MDLTFESIVTMLSICIILLVCTVCEAAPKDNEIRLIRQDGMETPDMGNVQIYHEGRWGAICDDGWTLNAAHVTCRMLGFKRALGHTKQSYFGKADKEFWLDDVQCYGTESHLTECTHNKWGKHNCDIREAAGVYCEPKLQAAVGGQSISTINVPQTSSTTRSSTTRGATTRSSTRSRTTQAATGHTTRPTTSPTTQQTRRNTGNPNPNSGVNINRSRRPIANNYNSVLGDDPERATATTLRTTHPTKPPRRTTVRTTSTTRGTTKSPKKVKPNKKENSKKNGNKVSPNNTPYDLRVRGGRTKQEGRVEIRINGGKWGVLCSDNWTLKEAAVVCRHAGLNYAQSAVPINYFGGEDMDKLATGIRCEGHEKRLYKCFHEHLGSDEVACPSRQQVAGVICTDFLPDLVPNATLLMRSAYLQDRQMYYLQCAMEEGCAASSAYYIQQNSLDWARATRRLLRFSSSTWNMGTADFRPFISKEDWEWHSCHMHYHSMEVFAHYDVLDEHGNRIAEGHKASFCLEDVQCLPGHSRKFRCQGYGDQGISVGCADDYLHDIDCQWIDMTDVKPGTYIFRIHVNPENKVAELSYDNNAVTCVLTFSGYTASVSDCVVHVNPEWKIAELSYSNNAVVCDLLYPGYTVTITNCKLGDGKI